MQIGEAELCTRQRSLGVIMNNPPVERVGVEEIK